MIDVFDRVPENVPVDPMFYRPFWVIGEGLP